MEKKNKQMTLDDRIEIQERLDKGMTFKTSGNRMVTKAIKPRNHLHHLVIK